MSKINYTYGILTGGVVPKDSPWYRNCTPVTYTCSEQKAAIVSLLGKCNGVDAIGCGADLLIKIMQCSDNYDWYIKNYDPINTYNDQLLFTTVPNDVITINTLSWWVDEVNITSEKFPVIASMPLMERVANTLINVMTLRG